jgi:hypothetical protein
MNALPLGEALNPEPRKLHGRIAADGAEFFSYSYRMLENTKRMNQIMLLLLKLPGEAEHRHETCIFSFVCLN